MPKNKKNFFACKCWLGLVSLKLPSSVERWTIFQVFLPLQRGPKKLGRFQRLFQAKLAFSDLLVHVRHFSDVRLRRSSLFSDRLDRLWDSSDKLVEHFGSWVCDRCAVCSSWTRRRTFPSDNGCKWLAVFQARPTKTNLFMRTWATELTFLMWCQ